MEACLLHITNDLSVRNVTHSFSATIEAHIPLRLYVSQIISSNTVNMTLLRSSWGSTLYIFHILCRQMLLIIINVAPVHAIGCPPRAAAWGLIHENLKAYCFGTIRVLNFSVIRDKISKLILCIMDDIYIFPSPPPHAPMVPLSPRFGLDPY